MKKLTIASTILAASMCLGTQSAMAAGSFDDKDMLFAFEAEKHLSMELLSSKEMLETEGEWVWFAYYAYYAYAPQLTAAAISLSYSAPRLGSTINSISYNYAPKVESYWETANDWWNNW